MRETVPVSVIIPCYNASKTIGRAIASVLAQTVLPCEIIIVDDKSVDNTLEVVREIIKKIEDKVPVAIFCNEINKGAGESRNIGWDAAKGEYIAFLDSDDAWFGDKLETQYRIMDNDKDISLSFHKIGLNNAKKACSEPAKCYVMSKYVALYKNMISTPGVMVKRNITHRFKLGKRYSEDAWLWCQILWDDMKVVRIDRELGRVFKYYYGESGLSGNMWAMEKGELGNYLYLFREGKIGIFLFTSASIFSLIKFIRRLVLKVCTCR